MEVSLSALARLFLKLGAIGFGGPLAHIALIQTEVADKRRWLAKFQLLEGLALCQALPGPTSTQLAIYSGYRIRGVRGALVAGGAFILPAFSILLLLTWFYFRYGSVPVVQGLFYGMTPVVLAMVLMSGYKLGKDAATDPLLLAILAAAAVLAAFFSINIVLLFAVAGILGIAVYGPRGAKGASSDRQLLMVSVPVLFQLGWFFLKTGSLIFGGGYVIIPLIENEVVNKLGWLTHKEFLDGLTLGQMTPGPVVITATFIGYKVAGWAGALLATAAIFAPSFAFIFLGIGTLRRVEHSPRVQAFLKTVTAAAVGAILGALWNLGTVSLFRPVPFVLFAAALTLMLRYKISFSKLLIAGAALGWLAAALFSP